MKKLANGALREYVMITLAHVERRDLTVEQVAKRLRDTFECCSIVIAKEAHNEDGGVHFHVALKNKSASKNNATKLIRKLFEEFEGSQCNVKFHRGWGIMIGYVTKEDKNPYVWGQYSLNEIMEMGESSRKRKRGAKSAKNIVEHIVGCKQWFDMYENDEVTERLIFGSYSNIRSVYEDLMVIKHTKKKPIQRIEEYLQERVKEKGRVEEYYPEDIGEKYILLDWLACNLMFRRPIKTKQLHIYGPPSTQKTLMFEALKKVLRIYFASSRINDFAGADDLYDLWVYDEFHLLDSRQLDGANAQAAQAYRNILLKVLDGQECRLDAKYSRIFTKKKNIPIIVISNTVTPMAREYGPFQERFIRLKFTTNIECMDEDRIIATLFGCMRRRAEQMGQHQIEGDAELCYNSDCIPAFDNMKIPYRSECEELELELFERTAAGEILKIQFDWGGGPRSEQTSEKWMQKYNFVKIEIDPIAMLNQRISALRFAIIPLNKREGIGEDKHELLEVFDCKKRGSNFSIRRRKYENYKDYMTWPMRVFLRNEKRVWPAEIYLNENLFWTKCLESPETLEDTSRSSKVSKKMRGLNDRLQIGVGTYGKRGLYSGDKNWDEDEWDTQD